MTATLTPEQHATEQHATEQHAPEQHATEQPRMTYQPQPDGAPPAGMYPAYGPGPWPPPPARKPRRGLAITGLVLGIIGVVLAATPVTFIAAFPLGILGVIFGAIGFRHGMGKAGAILGTIAVGLGIVWSVAWGNAINQTNDAVNSGQQGSVSQGLGSQDASGDVQVGQLHVENTYGVQSHSVPVTVTNNSSERSDYWITLALESADGTTQIDTANVIVFNLEPGQTSQQTGDFLGADNAPSDARVVVQQVERTAST